MNLEVNNDADWLRSRRGRVREVKWAGLRENTGGVCKD